MKVQYLIKHKLVRFAVAGAFNTGIDWLVYFLATRLFSMDDIPAKITGTVAGISSAYILNYLWVFQEYRIRNLEVSRTLKQKMRFLISSYVKMFLSYSFGMFWNVVIFSMLLSGGFPEFGSLVIATLTSFLLNFLLVNTYIFNIKKIRAEHRKA